MSTVVTFILGIVAGLYLHAQTKALHMPVFHLPTAVHIPVIWLLLAVIAVVVVFAHNSRGSKS